jgi:hypothetical protein
MYKKILFGLAMIALAIGVFAMTDTVFADDSGAWKDTWAEKELQTPYYGGLVNLEDANTPAWSRMGGVPGFTFGYDQLFAVVPEDALYLDGCGLPTVSYVRVRIQAMEDNLLENSVVAAIFLDEPGFPQVAWDVIDANGVIDFVGMIPAGSTYGVVFAEVGTFASDTDLWTEQYDTWITQGDEPGGGVILDYRNDYLYEIPRQIQFSTDTMAYWTTEWFPYTDVLGPHFAYAQYWLDIPAGTYNVGTQGRAHMPEPSGLLGANFIHYKDAVVVPELAFFMWTPAKETRIVAEVDVDGGIADFPEHVVYMRAYANVVDGFLYDDLWAGFLDEDGYLVFFYNPGFEWDLALVQDGDHYNWVLVSLAFNVGAGDLLFDLDETGVQFIEPKRDCDWDSAVVDLEMPGGNLTGRGLIDAHGDVMKHPWRILNINEGYPVGGGNCAEAVFLLAKAGCCGEPGPFCATVTLDKVEIDPRDCCEDEADEVVLNCMDEPMKWWYTFIPTIPCWDFPLLDISGLSHCEYASCLTPSYAPIFGGGPFTTVDPAVPAPGEFPASAGGVMLARAPWTDAFGNMIVDVRFDGPCVDICPSGCEACDLADRYVLTTTAVVPHYEVIENVTYDVVLEADGWEVTPLGPITDIGRYLFIASLEHGYLNDINGHKEPNLNVCCDPTGPCDCEDCEDDYFDSCENPHYVDFEETLFAISPDDARMASEWAWSWIEAMYELDLTAGTGPFTYGPSEVVNRAQMAVFMSKLATDAGLPWSGTLIAFPDVPAGHWAEEAISHVVEAGISTGCGGGNFCPLDPVNRAQMAIFIERTFRLISQYGGDFWWDTNLNILAPGDTFVDVPLDHWANIWIEELYYDGLTSGCKVIFPGGERYYCPFDPVTRGQMARFIVGAMLVPEDVQGFWPVLSPEME